jgi:hypothetical protein
MGPVCRVVLLLTSVLLVGCADKKPVRAHLVIPPECISEIRARLPIQIDDQGHVVGKADLVIKYNCVKSQRE